MNKRPRTKLRAPLVIRFRIANSRTRWRCNCNGLSQDGGRADFSKNLHTATAIPIIHSFPGNCTASAPVSTFICLWAIYIFPRSVHIFLSAEKADPSWEYIIRSLTHECGNWDRGPDIPFLGIFVSNFRHFVFAVHASLLNKGLSYDPNIGRTTSVSMDSTFNLQYSRLIFQPKVINTTSLQEVSVRKLKKQNSCHCL